MEKFKAYILLTLNGFVWFIIFVVTLPFAIITRLTQSVRSQFRKPIENRQ